MGREFHWNSWYRKAWGAWKVDSIQILLKDKKGGKGIGTLFEINIISRRISLFLSSWSPKPQPRLSDCKNVQKSGHGQEKQGKSTKK